MLARDEATSTSSVVSPRPLEHRPRVGFAMMGQPLRESLVPDALLDRLASVATVVDPLVLTEYDSERARRVLSQLDALITGWGAPRVTPELLAAADYVISLGCSNECRERTGVEVRDWPVGDPAEADWERLQEIVADIERRVDALWAEIQGRFAA